MSLVPPSYDGRRLVLLHDEAEVARAVARMARELDARLASTPALLLGLLTGGVYTAVWLSARLHTPHRIDFLRVGRYGSGKSGGEVRWEGAFALPEGTATVVVVDDVFDEGVTLTAVRARLLAAGAGHVLTAVLARKRRARAADIPDPDVVGLDVPDEWLVGCGLDYRGWGRHHPALYALRETAAPPRVDSPEASRA